MKGIDLNSLIPRSYYLKSYSQEERYYSLPPIGEIAKNFKEALKSGLDKINSQETKVKKMTIDLVSGKLENIHELMIEVQKAEVMLNFTLAVRDRLLRAYEELINILR